MTGYEVKHIRKREGHLVAFESSKITEAIFKAFKSVGCEDRSKAEDMSQKVVSVLKITCRDGRVPTVEEVQDLVEEILIENGYVEAAKSYILYRDQHAKLRDSKKLLENARKIVDDYLGRMDWRVNENSNMDYSLQGLNNYVSAEIVSRYWLGSIYPPEIRDAHSSGDFHIHDLGILGAYCCGWDLKDLLLQGFKGVEGKVQSAPPKHLRSALGQIVNFFYTLQGEAAGAQAFSNFDTLLAPFIRSDNLSYEEVKQAIQEFIFNLNVPTRVGFQTPFTNLSFDLEPSPTLKEEAAIVGGELLGVAYGDFQLEMDMINQAFCEIMMAGDAKGRIFSFPIPTYNITRDFDWHNEKLDALWKMTAKYGIPYFANFVSSDMKPEDTRSMCCRLRLDLSEIKRRGGGLFGSNPLTGSIGVVTINMSRIGYLVHNEEEFFSRLSKLMILAKDSLEIKKKVIERFTEDGLYPYSKFYLSAVKEISGNYWGNHFSTIGLIGMNEACLNFLGEDISSARGRKLAIDVLSFMRDTLAGFQKETQSLYNLEATPAESTSYRLARLDKGRFPNIVTSGETDPYYTNSTQLSVTQGGDVFEALQHQDDLQTMYTGGTVFHIFMGEKIDDPEAAKLLVKRITERFRLPYFTLTPTFSICPTHGYISGEHFECPQCGRPTEVYSRIVGFFRPVRQWNAGKKEEFQQRSEYKIPASVS